MTWSPSSPKSCTEGPAWGRAARCWVDCWIKGGLHEGEGVTCMKGGGVACMKGERVEGRKSRLHKGSCGGLSGALQL